MPDALLRCDDTGLAAWEAGTVAPVEASAGADQHLDLDTEAHAALARE